MRYLILFAASLMATACAGLPPAEMRLPPALAEQAAPIIVEGIGGRTKGHFYADAWQGRYERSEERLAFFDTVIRNSGHSGFVIEGPGISSTIEARCRMREKILDLGMLEFTPKPMSYGCAFTTDGNDMPARFELQEVRSGLGGALSRRERRGEIALGGEIVQIRSVHKLAGPALDMASPIGYVFEQQGRPVGAVELNGKPRLFLADPADEGLSRTIAIGAIALAIFWDPANSALGD